MFKIKNDKLIYGEIAIIRVSDLSQEAKLKLLEQYHFDATVDYEELF